MSFEVLCAELNPHQRIAATQSNQHTLVLAGAGTGKTKTIVAHTAHLISSGVPPRRIRIVAFTRRAADEIVERVKSVLGEQAKGLCASTFHAWCLSLIHRFHKAFGLEGFTVIDRGDQLLLFKALRGADKEAAKLLPTAAELCDLYSYARNTSRRLSETLKRNYPHYLEIKSRIVPVLLAYEEKKEACLYLDYDDILHRVARALNDSPKLAAWVGKQFDHLLIDEMQDTNPLQWSLISPLKAHCTLFCVGDDAQSIYGFRGADFKNVHSFQERVDNSVVLKLTKNYRSTQRILDVSNWLLAESELNYGKTLVAARGQGAKPELHTFSSEWDEAGWVVRDIQCRRGEGAEWRDHMIQVRSSHSAAAVESCLLTAGIPYRVIGGVKLLEASHVQDVLSVLRIVANPHDELAYMRFLTLFPGVGEVTASRLLARLKQQEKMSERASVLRSERKIPVLAVQVLKQVYSKRSQVAGAIRAALDGLTPTLESKYPHDWSKRQGDFEAVIKLAGKHTSILGFIEAYQLDPLHISMVKRRESDDVVTVITIHSAKGTECQTCYVINAGPGNFPSHRSMGNPEDVEEERRVLYVALTRAQDYLIVTRNQGSHWAKHAEQNDAVDAYFFNNVPRGLFKQVNHRTDQIPVEPRKVSSSQASSGSWIDFN